MMKPLAYILITILVIAGVGLAYFTWACNDDWCMVFNWQKIRATNTFEDCARFFPVMESYPRQCQAGDKHFVENVSPTVTPLPNGSATPEPTATVIPAGSGVYGIATLYPTCPVEHYPPEPQCAPRPYEGTFVIETLSGKVVVTSKTDANGKFSIALLPGTYIFTAPYPKAILPHGEKQFTVSSNRYTYLEVQLDSGIR